MRDCGAGKAVSVVSAFDPFLPLGQGPAGLVCVGMRPTAVCVPVQSAMVKILGVEKSNLLKRQQVRDGESSPLKRNKPIASEFLKRPVNVHRRQAGSLCDLRLSWWEIAGEAIGEPDRFHAKEHLT